jgi:predicted neuraminidase
MFEKVDIYSEIPGIPSCHCSSLIALPNGQLKCALFAGQYEKSPDVGIWGSTLDLSQDCIQWSKPEIIIKIPDKSMGSPVWYLTPTGKLFLFFHVLHHGRILKAGWSGANIQYITSDDLGNTWSSPQFLRKMWFWVIRCAIVVTKNNWVLMPVHREMLQYQSMVYMNDQLDLQGKWKRYGRLITPKGNLEPSIISYPDGELLCSVRTKDGWVFLSRSTDNGQHWSKPEKTSILNPNSQTCLIYLKSGRTLLMCNPVQKGRSPLGIFISNDRGNTWIEHSPIENELNQEFSYPAAIQTADGIIHVSYTRYRITIGYCRFDEEWLDS